MMNCLSGVRGLFKVQNSSEPCTRGVDMSSHMSQWTELARAVGADVPETPPGQATPSSPAKKKSRTPLGKLFTPKAKAPAKPKWPRVGFVDVEGQGAEDGTYDTMLALPLLLTSRVVLFNHKGAPTVSDMLSKLGVLARAAEYIDLGDEGDGGQEGAVWESMQEEMKGSKKFGHLHVLFRDFSFTGDKESVYQQLMHPEKVVKTLKAAKGHDPGAAAKERNDIRELLLKNFLSINVWLFRQPAESEELMSHNELPEEKINREFTATVRELLETVVEQTQVPTRFNGQVLSGKKQVSLLKQITHALNEGGIVSVPSVFNAMEKETLQRVTKQCIADFLAKCEALESKLPMPNQELTERASALNTEMFERFETELVDCSLDEELSAKRKELVDTASRVIQELDRKNGEATLSFLKKVVTTEVMKVRVAFERFCEKNIPVERTALLEEKFTALREEGRSVIEKKLQEYPQTLTMPEYQEVLLEQEEMLQEYLTLKTFQNESKIKDLQITKLHAEAIAQQERLIEQNKKLEAQNAAEKKTTLAMKNELKKLEEARAKEEERKREVEKLLAKQESELKELRKKRGMHCVIL